MTIDLLQLGIAAIVIIAVWMLFQSVPLLQPYQRVIQIVIGALVAIMLLVFIVGLLQSSGGAIRVG